MSALALLLVLFWVQASAAEQALEAGRFEEALELYERSGEPLERARGRVEVFYRAGDPQAALREARAGLASYPADLRLLLRACGASVWLGEAAAAAESGGRLEREIGAAELSPEEREAWRAAAIPLVARAQELLALDQERARAEVRARTVVLLTLAAAGAGLARLLAGAAGAAPGGAGR